jgi:hypothetical protein
MKNLILICFATFTTVTLAFSGSADTQLDKIIEQYSKIHSSLAKDSTEGVDAAAKSIVGLADQLGSEDASLARLAKDLGKAAQDIQGKNLEATRTEFFELSKPLLVYLNQSYSGSKEYYRYYCSMAKKGWVQLEEGTRNPYYGSSMLTCGELIK